MSPFQQNDIEYLVQRIIDEVHSPESQNFYRRAISALGPGVVEELLGEVRYRSQVLNVEHPAKYLNTLLRKEMESTLKNDSNGDLAASEIVPFFDSKTHLSPSSQMLFSELTPIAPEQGEKTEDLSMAAPYSKMTIPWATLVGPTFFTLTSNKEKSDRVSMRIPTMNGEVLTVPVIRGRYSKNGEERGILTTEHGRILGALESLWVEQGCKYSKSERGRLCSYFTANVIDIARILGYKSFGGAQLSHLKDRILDLKSKPYYFEFEKTPLDKRGMSFFFLDRADLLDISINGKDKARIEIGFSHQYSLQLLSRRAVSRPKEITQVKGELAFLIRLYIESILMSNKTINDFKIELSRLIYTLKLPSAGWHKYKSQRHNQFKKHLKELNEMKTSDGRGFKIWIEESSSKKDFLLCATLKKTDI